MRARGRARLMRWLVGLWSVPEYRDRRCELIGRAHHLCEDTDCIGVASQVFMYHGPHGPTVHGSDAPMIADCMLCTPSLSLLLLISFAADPSSLVNDAPFSSDTHNFLKVLRKMQVENITIVTIDSKAINDLHEIGSSIGSGRHGQDSAVVGSSRGRMLC